MGRITPVDIILDLGDVRERLKNPETPPEQIMRDLAYCINQGASPLALEILKDARIDLGSDIESRRAVLRALEASKPPLLPIFGMKAQYRAVVSEIQGRPSFHAVRTGHPFANPGPRHSNHMK